MIKPVAEFAEMMRPKQVAAVFKVPVRTVYNWISDGTLPSIQVGRTLCVPKSAVSERFEQLRYSPQKPRGRPAAPRSQVVTDDDRDIFGPRR